MQSHFYSLLQTVSRFPLTPIQVPQPETWWKASAHPHPPSRHRFTQVSSTSTLVTDAFQPNPPSILSPAISREPVGGSGPDLMKGLSPLPGLRNEPLTLGNGGELGKSVMNPPRYRIQIDRIGFISTPEMSKMCLINPKYL